jgi:hypothetical protein
VLARLRGARRLRILGEGRGAVHLDLDGFVVSVLAATVPMMANAVRIGATGLPLAVSWDPAAPPAWDPAVPRPAAGREEVAELAGWIAARAEIPRIPLEDAAVRLLGRGAGLTPEGDDVLCGAALGVRALAPAAGLAPAREEALAAALCPEDARARTSALSATLLALARAGAGPEPVQRLLAGPGRATAWADLARLGASTGLAVGAGIGLAARYLVDTMA